MPDMFSPSERSAIMSRIRSTNTLAERLVFAHLRKEKVYFQKHYKRAPGKPDIALPRKKRAVFIDGDFWHGKQLAETIDRLPSTYWKSKIDTNMRRDTEINRMLASEGWQVLRVWESDVKRKRTRDKVLNEVKEFLADGRD
jgi:DNA mismatch endonuclease (patch repair protein)